ncbi:MAG: DUF3667 domain-containing protein [Bacteroidota bacterium]
MTCVNCGAEGNGNFCSNCGQALHVKRIRLKDAWEDIWEHVSGFDGKFFRTFKDLTIRPGFAAREFINGNRARYYGPVAYYLLMITVFLLWLEFIDLSFVDYIKAMQKTITNQNDTPFTANIRKILSDNLKIFAFFVVPFVAYASRRIYFRKQGLNLLEHSVPIFYMLGHWYWFQMAEATLLRFTGITIGSMAHSFLIALYVGYGYVSFVPDQPRLKVFLKGTGVYLTGFFLFMVAVVIVVSVWVAVLFATDPSQLDAIRPPKSH